jgi:WhiB family redox-sensing transcriptional regulator
MTDDDFRFIDDSFRPPVAGTGDPVDAIVPLDHSAAPPQALVVLAPLAHQDVDGEADDGADEADEADEADAEGPLDADGRPELSLVDLTGGLTGLSGLTPEDPGWQELALCAQTDPEAFFPEKGGSTREAKRVCQSCEVRQECLEYALGNDERFGIWGGLSERERRRLKRRIS